MARIVTLSYMDAASTGVFSRGQDIPEGVWLRLRNSAKDIDRHARISSHRVEVSWPAALHLLRTLSALQERLGFEFDTDSSSQEKVERFIRDYQATRLLDGDTSQQLSVAGIESQLATLCWNVATHTLKPYQLENVQRLLALSNGANFSVPGAGKTTVTFALHLLTRENIDRLLVVAPRNAFPAWESVIDECLLTSAAPDLREDFVTLSGGETRIAQLLRSPSRRFMISYDQLVRVDAIIERYLASNSVHLVLDESHRMKAGTLSQRGSALLRMGHLAGRRDILSGTPMPQSNLDLQSQLDFLWPGAGLGSRIATGERPKQVLGNLYVRTTKQDLDLPDRKRVPVPVQLTDAHLAFYAVLRDDVRAQASAIRKGSGAIALIKARRSVVRMMQAAVNPELVADKFLEEVDESRSGLLRAVLEEGPSARIRAAADLARALVAEGRKVLLWTIFTSTIDQLKSILDDLNPALIFGAIGVGDEADDETRQGQIRRFKTDQNCKVLIANPAAAAEGISLHQHCHDAIYVDRSYNATHYLQSIDRIHRLGLPPDIQTTIYVLHNQLPSGIGSIDASIGRRLAAKIRNMELLLEDPDLNDLALDEENTLYSIEDSIDAKDIDDLIAELEDRAPHSDDDDFI